MDDKQNDKLLKIHNLSAIAYEKLVIYGAGEYGKLVYSFLALNGLKENVICFAVSDKKKNPDIIYEVPIICIDNIKSNLKEYTVIVAMGVFNTREAFAFLKNLKVKKVYGVTGDIMAQIRREILIGQSRQLPLEKNKIFFFNGSGMDYRGNCKYIAEKLIEGNYPVKMVWVIRDRDVLTWGIPNGIRKVVINSDEYYKELFTSGIYVTNGLHELYEYKREEQFYISTWHGYGPFKIAIATCDDDNMTRNKAASCDLFTTASAFYADVYRNTFGYKGEIYKCGAPRNDVFFTKNRLKQKIRDKFQIPSEKNILLYAPTFRTNMPDSFEFYDINMGQVLKALKKRFRQEYVLLYRFHPSLCYLEECMQGYFEGINVTFYPDIQELLVAADVVITDYSSLMWDFSLQRKPVFLYQSDEVEYSNDRGFYAPVSEWPYPNAHTQAEFIEEIEHFDEKKYLQDLELFLEKYGSCDDGHASERIVKRIMDIIGE